MEIKTTQVTCPNGHHYDTAQYGACPVCGASVGGFPHTEPVNGGGAFGKTEPVYGAGVNPGNSGSSYYDQNAGIQTEPSPNMRSTDANGPSRFSIETQIGGDIAVGSQVEPVVGWLVCIDGPVRGVDYRIHAGYNYIGRDYGDIHIKGDQQISRENHAMIAFDSVDNTFFVGPAAGRNLIKVNGKTVINAIEINRGDVISIGTTRLIFIPLCGEEFSWVQGVKPNA